MKTLNQYVTKQLIAAVTAVSEGRGHLSARASRIIKAIRKDERARIVAEIMADLPSENDVGDMRIAVLGIVRQIEAK